MEVVVLGDRAPGLGALKDRDAPLMRRPDLGIVVMDGGGAHDKFHVLRDILGMVPDQDGNALQAQPVDIGALVHVRTADAQAHALQHLGQRRHGHAPDADQMSSSARGQEIFKFSHSASPQID